VNLVRLTHFLKTSYLLYNYLLNTYVYSSSLVCTLHLLILLIIKNVFHYYSFKCTFDLWCYNNRICLNQSLLMMIEITFLKCVRNPSSFIPFHTLTSTWYESCILTSEDTVLTLYSSLITLTTTMPLACPSLAAYVQISAVAAALWIPTEASLRHIAASPWPWCRAETVERASITVARVSVWCYG